MEERIKRTIEALRRNRMKAQYAPDRRHALEEARAFVPDQSALIGVGGSVTLGEIGLMDTLSREGFNFVNQYEEGISREESLARRHRSLGARVFFTSTNALTENGWLVNVDGMGNRVAAMAFGPDRVVVVAGRNKICPSLEDALERIRTVAAPRNVRRLERDNPCAETGECQDCESDTRICCITSIIKWQADPDRLHVILVDEELGY